MMGSSRTISVSKATRPLFGWSLKVPPTWQVQGAVLTGEVTSIINTIPKTNVIIHSNTFCILHTYTQGRSRTHKTQAQRAYVQFSEREQQTNWRGSSNRTLDWIELTSKSEWLCNFSADAAERLEYFMGGCSVLLINPWTVASKPIWIRFEVWLKYFCTV